MVNRRLTPVVFVLAVFGGSCGGTSPDQPSSGNGKSSVAAFVASAVAQPLDSTAVAAVMHSGSPPAASGGPTATVTSSPDAVAGSQNLVLAQSATAVQTLYVSIGSSLLGGGAIRSGDWASRLLRPLIAPLAAAGQSSDYLQLALTTPATVVPVVVTYPGSLPSGNFTLQIQVAGANGAPGPIAVLSKVPLPPAVELLGVVYGHWIGTARTPGERPDPVAGATISTSLDSRTATTDAHGLFDLKTGVSSTACFTINVSAPGLPTYSAQRRFGSDALVAYTLGSNPQYPVPSGC